MSSKSSQRGGMAKAPQLYCVIPTAAEEQVFLGHIATQAAALLMTSPVMCGLEFNSTWLGQPCLT